MWVFSDISRARTKPSKAAKGYSVKLPCLPIVNMLLSICYAGFDADICELAVCLCSSHAACDSSLSACVVGMKGEKDF